MCNRVGKAINCGTEMPPSNDHLHEAIRFLLRFPAKGDRDLVILKGHLLIEEQLHKFVNEKLANPSALSDRFTFHHYLCLARAVTTDLTMDWIWDGASRLNALRNLIAHSVEPKDVQQKIDDFVALVGQNQTSPLSAELVDEVGQFPAAIMSLHASLSARAVPFTTGLRIG